MLSDNRTPSTDYSLVLMLDPQSRHSYVYYAVSVDFVGDHMQSLHSNDHSTFVVIALASNTEVKISPNRNVVIDETSVSYGQEYVMELNLSRSKFFGIQQ